MKILKLKLRGAIGIRKGLGLEEIEIDFSNFQSGLIALTGRNGSGKTTIMENLHPYRMMVSRDGSLQNHFYLKDSYRILEFEQNGNIYESKILIDALTGGSEAYLRADTKKGYGFSPMNDGKLTTYDEAIENLLGSPDLFFNSVFSGQKSKGIAELKPADRRKLFYELLNLDIYEKYLEKAKADLKQNELKLSQVEGEINALQNDQPSMEELTREKEDLQKNEEKLIDEITRAEKEIESINSEIKKIEVNIRLDEQKVEDNKSAQGKVVRYSVDIKNLTEAHNAKITRYNSDITDAKKLIERNDKLLQNKDSIESNIQKIEELDKELFNLSESRSELNKNYSVYQEGHSIEKERVAKREKALTDDKMFFEKLKNNFNQKKKEIERIQTESKIISEVPCTEEVGSGCQFLQNAYAGKKSLNTLIAELNGITNQVENYDTEIKKETAWVADETGKLNKNFQATSSGYKQSLDALDKDIQAKRDELTKLKTSDWKKLQKEADEAGNNNKILQEKISSITTLIDESKKSFDNELQRIKDDISALTEKIDTDVERRLDEARSELKNQNLELTNKTTDLRTSKDVLESINRQLAAIDQQIEQVKQNDEKIGKLQEAKAKAENEIKEWNFLCKAFDKTGIPVLKLENSSIEITSITNQLLSFYDDQSRILFETTKLSKDKKKLIEDFGIIAIDAHNIPGISPTMDVNKKSGGEKVWYNTALQESICILKNQNKGKDDLTIFLDEQDGPLDSLGAVEKYFAMLSKVHELTKAYQTIIITHRQEILDFIPQQIKLRDGILEILN